jgi:hypothetical protein
MRGTEGFELHDINRDEVGIIMLVKITRDNDYNCVPIIKGLNW